jgi:hypothetical protein
MGLGGRFHADQNFDLRVFALDDAAEVAHVGGLNVSGFDGKNNLLGLAAAIRPSSAFAIGYLGSVNRR